MRGVLLPRIRMTIDVSGRLQDSMVTSLLGASEEEVRLGLEAEQERIIGRGGVKAWRLHLIEDVMGRLVAAGMDEADAGAALREAVGNHADPTARLEGLAYITRLAEATGMLEDHVVSLGRGNTS